MVIFFFLSATKSNTNIDKLNYVILVALLELFHFTTGRFLAFCVVYHDC